MTFKIKDGFRVGTVDVVNSSGTLLVNAPSATVLQTARTINGIPFDGSSNITIASAAANALTFGSGLTSSGSYDGGIARTVSIDSTVALKADTHYVGTTAITLNRASANQHLTGILSITLPGSTSGTVQFLPNAVSGSTVLTLPATTGTLALTSDITAVNNGTLGAAASSAGATGTTVETNFSGAWSANSSSNVTIKNLVGPSLSALATVMSGGATGFIKKSAADSYTLDSSTYLTAESDTLQSVTTRGASSTVALTLSNATASTSTSTGALIITGGLGVGGAIYAGSIQNTAIGSTTRNTGAFTTLTANGQLTATASTASSSTGTGALVVTGGTGIGGDLNVGGNTIIGGNLTVNGTTYTVNSTVTTLDDPIMTLGGDTAPVSDDNKDRGIEFRWHNGTVAKTGFFGYDDSTGYLTFIPDGTNTGEVYSGTMGDIQATNFRGALIGNASSATTATTATSATTATNLAGGNSTTLLGSIPYQSNTNTTTLLAPNTTSTKKFLRMTGTGTNGAAPVWDTILDADLPSAITGATYNGLTLTALGTGFSIAGGTSSVTASFIGGSSYTISGSTGTTITLPSSSGTLALNNQVHYVGTTSVAANRTSAALSLTGIPSIDGVAADAATLWGSVTTGSITIGSGLSTGTLNLAAAGTGATSINIGHTNAATVITGSVNLPTLGTSGFVKLTAGGALVADTSTFLTTETDTLSSVTGRGATTGTALTLTNTTTTTSTTTGALIVSGGVAVQKSLAVAGDIIQAAAGAAVVSNQVVTTASVSSTTLTAIDTWPLATYRAAKYQVAISQGSGWQFSEISILHNGTSTVMSEFDVLETGTMSGTVTFTSDISGGNVRLLTTNSSATACAFKIVKTLIVV